MTCSGGAWHLRRPARPGTREGMTQRTGENSRPNPVRAVYGPSPGTARRSRPPASEQWSAGPHVGVREMLIQLGKDGATPLGLGRTPPAAEGPDQVDAGVHLEVDGLGQRQLVSEQRALGVEDQQVVD